MHSIDYDSIADLYDLYVTADYDVAFFTEEVAKTTGPVLELMAGTGRLSIPLIESGAQLTCVDSSQRMLDVLSRKLDERELQADVVCTDVSELRLPTRFDLAIIPFQGFMEIVDPDRQRSALGSIYDALEFGGRLICTLHNPPIRRASVDGTLRIVGTFPSTEGTLVVSGFETGGDPVVKRLQYFELFGTEGIQTWKQLLPMEFAFIERDEFEAMAREAGFRVVTLYGDYQRAPFDAGTSPVMIWELVKS